MTYNKYMRCPECGSDRIVKNGRQKGKQTYLCRNCSRRFTPDATKKHRPKDVRELAIGLFCEGLSIASISRKLNIPYKTVHYWIKSAGKRANMRMIRELERLKKRGKAKRISIDEMHAHVGSKDRDIWIWSVVVELRDGTIKKFLFVGDRSLGSFLKDFGTIA